MQYIQLLYLKAYIFLKIMEYSNLLWKLCEELPYVRKDSGYILFLNLLFSLNIYKYT
jgi:hypothetical protein